MTTQSIERRKASVYEGSMHQRPISERWPEIGQHKGTKDSTTDKRSRDGAQGNEAALGTLAGGVGLIKLARTQQIVGPPERNTAASIPCLSACRASARSVSSSRSSSSLRRAAIKSRRHVQQRASSSSSLAKAIHSDRRKTKSRCATVMPKAKILHAGGQGALIRFVAKPA
jgi:hypothetical protein